MLLTRLAVGLEPLNAVDAAHRSPDPRQPQAGRNLVPPLDRLLADPFKRNKELSKRSLYFPRLPKRKLRCSFTPNRAAPDEWDADFRQTKSKTRVPIRYAFSI